MFLHFGTARAFLIWRRLGSDMKEMKSLNHLFITNIDDLCLIYELNKKRAQIYLKVTKYIKYFIFTIMVLFEFFFLTFLMNCLRNSFAKLGVWHALLISTPFNLITFFSYHNLTVSILAMYFFEFNTQRFIAIRWQQLEVNFDLFIDFLRYYYVKYNSKKLFRKKEQGVFQLLSKNNKIILQFEQTNKIFDRLCSFVYINCLIVSFGRFYSIN